MTDIRYNRHGDPIGQRSWAAECDAMGLDFRSSEAERLYTEIAAERTAVVREGLTDDVAWENGRADRDAFRAEGN